jgi:hypothetical protein
MLTSRQKNRKADAMWRKRIANTLSLGALVWAMTVSVAILTAIGAARTGKGWTNAVLATAIAVGCTLAPWFRAASARRQARRRDRLDGTLTVDHRGVTRVAGQQRETVAWQDLVSVRIRTTSDGPRAEDMFFVLTGTDGTSCVVPNRLAVAARLLTALQERLPDLDNKAVARAAGVCTEAWFTIWARRPPAQRETLPKSRPISGSRGDIHRAS